MPPLLKVTLKLSGFKSEVLPLAMNCKTSAQQMSTDFEASLKDGSGDIMVEADGDEQIPAHSQILCYRCPFFKKILTSRKKSNAILRLEGLDKDTAHDLLEYIYTGTVTNIAATAERLLVVAGRFNLDVLKVLCEKSLTLQDITTENKDQLLKLAVGQNAEYLQSHLERN